MKLIKLSQYKAREIIIGIIFLLLTLSSSYAYAEGQDIWQVQDVTLTNGLRVLLLEDRRTPTVTIQVWYRVGSRNECLGMTGISHMLEHMMFRGAKEYGPGAFSERVEKNGGTDNAFTTEDYTVYFESIASQKVNILLDLESDRMADMLLDPKLFLLEKNVVIEERRLRTEDNPVSDLFEQIDAAAFIAHPYHSPVIGWMSDIEQVTPEDVYNYYKTNYAPNNAVLVAVGDFKSEELLSKIEKSFRQKKTKVSPPKVRSIEPPQRGEKRVTLKRIAELSFVAVAYHTPNLTGPDSFALEVLSTVLAKGDSSRLYKSLVYDKRVALSIGGDYSRLNIDPSLAYFYAQVLPGGNPIDVENAIYDEIDKIKKEPISQYELEKARNQLESSFVFSQGSLFGRGFLLGQYEILGSWRMVRDYISGISAVRAEDVLNVAKKYLTQDNRTVGVLIPQKPQS